MKRFSRISSADFKRECDKNLYSRETCKDVIKRLHFMHGAKSAYGLDMWYRDAQACCHILVGYFAALGNAECHLYALDLSMLLHRAWMRYHRKLEMEVER